MKTKKLLRKVKVLLSADRRAQLAKYDSLKKVLRKLRAKEAALRDRLDGEEDDQRRREIQRKLEVIEAQCKKGARLKKEIEDLRENE
jgi:hypothetical protein